MQVGGGQLDVRVLALARPRLRREHAAAVDGGEVPEGELVAAFRLLAALVDSARVDGTYSGKSEDEVRAQFVGRQPMGRLGTEDELKGVVVFLASAAASFLTGQTIVVDGGETSQ